MAKNKSLNELIIIQPDFLDRLKVLMAHGIEQLPMMTRLKLFETFSFEMDNLVESWAYGLADDHPRLLHTIFRDRAGKNKIKYINSINKYINIKANAELNKFGKR